MRVVGVLSDQVQHAVCSRTLLFLLPARPLAAALATFSGLRDLVLYRFERLRLAALPPSLATLHAQVRGGCGSPRCLRASSPAAAAAAAFWVHSPQASNPSQPHPSPSPASFPAITAAQLPALAPLLPPELEEELAQLLGGAAGVQVQIGVPLAGPLRPLAGVSAARGLRTGDAFGSRS